MIHNPGFILLRAGLWEAPELLRNFPPLTAVEWETIYEQSKRQTVSGIIYQALSYLPEEQLPPSSLLLRWTARVHRIELSYSRMERAIASLAKIFGSEGLHPVLQKGHAVAQFYPQPQLRVCGDIDLYFPEAQRREADDIISRRGAALHHAPDGASVYNFGGIEVEHHSRLIELSSPLASRRLQSLLALKPRPLTLSDGTVIDTPAPLTNLIMINVHIMKHSIGMGIGLRHFCDYAVAYRRLIPKIGEKKYLDTCRQLGIARWTNILHSFINNYLSCPIFPALPVSRHFRHLPQRLLSLVMEGGNFGLFRREKVERGGSATLRRKSGTLRAFLSNGSLAMRLAPAETLATILRLVRGNVFRN